MCQALIQTQGNGAVRKADKVPVILEEIDNKQIFNLILCNDNYKGKEAKSGLESDKRIECSFQRK